MRAFWVFLSLLSLASCTKSSCTLEDRVSSFRCYGKLLRAEDSMARFNSSFLEENLNSMVQSCKDFTDCINPLKDCAAGFQNVKTKCDKTIFNARFDLCFGLITINTELLQDLTTDSFRKCKLEASKENKTECDILKECTESMVNENCHPSVLPMITEKFGSIFYDVAECNETEGSGSQ